MIPSRSRLLLLSSVHTGFAANPALCSVGTVHSFPREKEAIVCEADHSCLLVLSLRSGVQKGATLI
jgi:hypothetical protein